MPADYCSGEFPAAPLNEAAPGVASYAVRVARNLQAALSDRSVAAVCREAGLARTTVQDLLAGRTWPDLVTLAKLEIALGVVLWPVGESR